MNSLVEWRHVRLHRKRHNKEMVRRKLHRKIAFLTQCRIEAVQCLAPKTAHPIAKKRRARRLEPPETLNLSTHYGETIEFLRSVRDCAKTLSGQFYVDFKPLRSLTAAGALMLVAEFDRWRELLRRQKLSPLELEKWDPDVRRRLREMGFFELLGSACPVDDGPNTEGERFLPFSSGHRTEGDKAKALRIAIEGLGPNIRDRNALFDGLTEAMTNVEHHAYAANALVKRWWMSASVDSSAKRLTVMFLDHGSSIPRTLDTEFFETLRQSMSNIGVLASIMKSDAKLIEAAVTVHRSSTNESHRGWGLRRDIQGYIERHDAFGSLRIISGRGQYTYQKHHNQPPTIATTALPVAFSGTFIEWIIEEYAEGEQDEHNDQYSP